MSREVGGAVCRLTVSSAVSPVGPDLVGSSVAERERVSPQRARFEGAVRVPRIASSVFALSLGGMSGDGEARAAFRALLSTERAGYKLASALVSTLVSYLVGTAKLSDVSELDMSILLTVQMRSPGPRAREASEWTGGLPRTLQPI